jgi:predicted TIM-barrel fold metal-dependent hydrolase
VNSQTGHSLIDADTHVNEPPDLWSTRLPKKYLDRAPRMQRFDEGDAWILEGVKDPINFGLNAAAGLDIGVAKGWVKWEDLRAGGYDPAVRLQEMDRDGVDAATLYPTPRLSGANIANPDPEFHLELIRAYNDWLSDYCAHDPKRLGGLMLLPNCGVEHALAEFDRVGGRSGIVGVLLGRYPNGSLQMTAEDDAMWKAASAGQMPVHIHVGLTESMPSAHAAGSIPGDVRFYDAPKRILQFVMTGVFDRVPDLDVVMVEVDAGWLPYFKQQVGDRYERLGLVATGSLDRHPVAYIEDHFYFTIITDTIAIENRHTIGVDRLMWSSDYPHMGADWPHSWRSINHDFASVPKEERDLMLVGNAQRLYKFGE